MKHLTHSSIKTLRRCPYMYKLSYVDKIKESTHSEALNFGSMFHDALEHGEVRQPGYTYMLPEEFALLQKKVTALYVGYTRYWGDTFETVDRELEFSVDIGHPVYKLAGKIDRVIKSGNGYAVLETKTTGSDIKPGSDYWKQLRNDPQVTTYAYALTQLGYPCNEIQYDVIKRPTINVRKNDTVDEYIARLCKDITSRPEFYFQRTSVPRLDDDFKRFKEDTYMEAEVLALRESQGLFPRSAQCRQPFKCRFIDICNSPDDALPGGFYYAEKQHSELSIGD